MKSWLRDLIVSGYNPAKVINADLTESIRQTSKKCSVNSLLRKINVIETAQRDLEANANVRLTLELMMMRLAKDPGAR